MTRVCSTCAAPIGPHGLTGLCKACIMRERRQDPAMEARRAAAYRQRMEDPEFRQAHARRSQERLSAWRKTPDAHEVFAALGRQNVHHANTPAARHKAKATKLAGIPQERWDEYGKLRAQHGAKEARRIILADLAAKERARLAKLSPFERQMAALARGARLVETPPRTRAEPTMTLGGVSSGLL